MRKRLSYIVFFAAACCMVHGAQEQGPAFKKRKTNAGQAINVSVQEKNLKLHEAVDQMDYEQVQHLIKTGADINAKDRHGMTSLHKSARTGYLEITRLLVQDNSVVNNQDNFGCTPLHYAAMKGCCAVTQLLLASGADFKICDRESYTPILYSLAKGHYKLTTILLQAQAYEEFIHHSRDTAKKSIDKDSRVKAIHEIKVNLANTIAHKIVVTGIASLLGAQHHKLGVNSPAKILPCDNSVVRQIALLLLQDIYDDIYMYVLKC